MSRPKTPNNYDEGPVRTGNANGSRNGGYTDTEESYSNSNRIVGNPQGGKKSDDGAATMDDAPWMETAFLEMYQEMRELESKHSVKIAVPEFLFFGFQSAGKTSTLSVVSGVPAGTMKDGTGTRCPVRYTMAHSPDAKVDKIYVQGGLVKNYEEQIDRVCNHMKSLADQNRFSAEIYEVRIESPKVPNMIFVDMPGMLRNDSDERFAEWKKQLEIITCELLGKISSDGESYAFIPVFVKAAHEKEEQDLVYYVDDLLKRVRPRWKDDALFIVNKFDRLGNMDKGKEMCEILTFLSEHGETVFTITNPYGAHTARMTPNELTEHIQSVPNQEKEWWDKLLYELQRSYDDGYEKLSNLRNMYCGTPLMKEILKRKMIEIVKKTLPMMKMQLENAKMEKEDKIAALQRELQLGDPSKLKELVQRFNVRFLSMMKEFYHARDHSTLNGIRRHWKGEMRDFHTITHFQSKHALIWEQQNYYIKPKELKKLLKKTQRDGLASQIDMKLCATSSLKRALDLWIAMISFMNFPLYNDTDILNMSVSFDGTIQSDPWETARNIVYHASEHLRRGVIWLAEFLRYRVKTNADIIFKAAVREFEETAHYEETDLHRNAADNDGDDFDDKKDNKGDKKEANRRRTEWTRRRTKTDEKMIRLLKIGKMDYDKVVDYLVNDFIDTIEKIPHDQTECLDKKFVANAMRYGRALNSLWDYAVNYRMDHSDRIQYNYQGIAGGKPPPSLQANAALNDPNSPQTPALNGQQSQQQPQSQHQQQQPQVTRQKSKKSKHRNGNGYDTNPQQQQQQPQLERQETKNDAYDGQDPNMQAGNGKSKNKRLVSDEDLARPAGLRDVFFFKTLYPAREEFMFNMRYENDVDLIYNLARVQWAAVKHHVISSVQQQMSHRIMKEITFEGGQELFSNATLRGWDRPQIAKVISKLTKRTNIPSSQFELLIDQAPIPASKAVMQMSNDELLAIYGAELKEKQKQYDQLVIEYKEFLDAKKAAEIKIEEVKQMEIS